MNISLLLAFVAHLGVSLASQIEVNDTGDEKTVSELMAIYESLFGVIEPDSLLAQRQALSPRSEAGGHQGLTDGHIAGGLWPNDGSISEDLEQTFDSVGDLLIKDFIPKDLNSPDSSEDGSLSPADYSFRAGDQGSIESFVYGGSKSHDGRKTGGLPYTFHSIGAGQLSPRGFIASGQNPQDGFSQGRLLHNDNTFGGNLGSPEHFGAGGSYSRVGHTTEGTQNVLYSVSARQQSPDDFIAGGRKPQDGSLHEDVLNNNTFSGDLGSPEQFSSGGSYSRDGPTSWNSPNGLQTVSEGQQFPEGFIASRRKPQDSSSHGGLLHSDNTVRKNIGSPEHFGAEGSYSRDRRTTGGLQNVLHSVGAGQQSPEGFIAGRRMPPDGSLHGGVLHSEITGGGDLGSPEHFGAGGMGARDGRPIDGLPYAFHSIGASTLYPEEFIAGERKPQDGSLDGSLLHSDNTVGEDLGSPEHFSAGSSYSRDRHTTEGVPNVLHSESVGRLSPISLVAERRKPQEDSLNGGLLHSDNTVSKDVKSPEHFGSGSIYSRDRHTTEDVSNVLHSGSSGQQSPEGSIDSGQKPQDGSLHGGLLQSDNTVGRDVESPEHFGSGGSYSRDRHTTGDLPKVLHSVGAGQQSFAKSLIASGRKPQYGYTHGGVLYSDNTVGGDLGSPGHFGAGGSYSGDGRTTGGLPNFLHSVGAGQPFPKGNIAAGRKPQDSSSHGGLLLGDNTVGGDLISPKYFNAGGSSYSRDRRTPGDFPNVLHSVSASQQSPESFIVAGGKPQDGSPHGGVHHSDNTVGGDLGSPENFGSAGSYSRHGRTTGDLPKFLHSVGSEQQSPEGFIAGGRKPQKGFLQTGILHSDNTVDEDLGSPEHFGAGGSYSRDGRTIGALPNVLHSVGAVQQSPSESLIAVGRKLQYGFPHGGVHHSDNTLRGDVGSKEHFGSASRYSREGRKTGVLPNVLHSDSARQQSPEGFIAGGGKLQKSFLPEGVLHSDNTVRGGLGSPEHFSAVRSFSRDRSTTEDVPNVLHPVKAGQQSPEGLNASGQKPQDGSSHGGVLSSDNTLNGDLFASEYFGSAGSYSRVGRTTGDLPSVSHSVDARQQSPKGFIASGRKPQKGFLQEGILHSENTVGGDEGSVEHFSVGGSYLRDRRTTEDIPNVFHSVKADQESPGGLIGGGQKPQDGSSHGGLLHSNNTGGGDLGSPEHFGAGGMGSRDGRLIDGLLYAFPSIGASTLYPEEFIAGERKPQDGSLDGSLLHSDNTVGEDLGSPEHFSAGSSYSRDRRTTEGVPNILHSESVGRLSPISLVAEGRKPQEDSLNGSLLHSDNTVSKDVKSPEHFGSGSSYSRDRHTTEDVPNVLHLESSGLLFPEGFIDSEQKPQDGSLHGGLLQSDNTVGGDVESPEHFGSGGSYFRHRSTIGGLANGLHSIGAGQQFSAESLIGSGRKPHYGSTHGGVLHGDNTVGGDLGSPGHFGAGGSYSRDGRSTGGLPNVLYSVGEGQQSPAKSFNAGGRKLQDRSPLGGVLHRDNTVVGDLVSPKHFGAGGSESSDGRIIGGLPYAIHSIGAGQPLPKGIIAAGRKPQDSSSHGGLLHGDNTVGGDLRSPKYFNSGGGSDSLDRRTPGDLPNVLHSEGASQQSPESFIAGGRKPQDGSPHGGVHHSDNTVCEDLRSPENFGSAGSYSRHRRTTGDLPNVFHSVGGDERYPEGFIAGGRKLQEGFLQGSIFRSDNTVGGDLGSLEHFSAGVSYLRDGRTTEDVPNVLHSVEAGQHSPEGLIGGGRKPQDFSSDGGVLHSDKSVGGDLGSNGHFGSAGSYFGDGRTTKDLPNVLHSVAAREQSPEGFIAGGWKSQKGFLQAGILHSDNTVGEDLGSPEHFGAGGSYSLDGRTTEDVPNVLHSVEAGQQSPEGLIGGGQKPQDFSSDGGVLHSDNSVGGDLGSNEHFGFADSYFGDGRTTGDLLNVLHSVNVGQQSPEGFVASRRKPQKSFLQEGILHSDNTVGGDLGSPEHFSDVRSYSRDRRTTEHVPNVLHSVEAGQQSTEGLNAGGRTPQDGSSYGGVLSSDNTLNGDLGAPEYFGSAGSYSRVGRTTGDLPRVLHSVDARQQSPESFIAGGRKPQIGFLQEGILHSDNTVGGDIESPEHFSAGRSYPRYRRTTEDVPNVLNSIEAGQQSPEGLIAGGRKPQEDFLQGSIFRSDNTVGGDLGSLEHFSAGGSYSLDGRTTEDVPNVLHSVEAGQQSPEGLIGGGQKPQDFSSDGGVLHSDNSVGGDLGSNEHFGFADSYFGDGRTTGDLLNVLHSVNVGQQSPEGFVASRRKPQKSFLQEGIVHSDNTVGGDLGSPEHFSDVRSYSRDRRTTEHVPNVLHSVEAGQQSTEGLNAGGRTPQDGSSYGGVLSSDNTLNGDLGAPEYFGSAGSYSRVGRTTGDLPRVLHSVDARQQSPESFIAGGRKPQIGFLQEGILHSDNTVGGDIESPEHFSAGRSYPRYRRTTEDVPNVLNSIEAGQQSPEGLIAGGRKPQEGFLQGSIFCSDNTVGGDLGSLEHFSAGGSFSRDGRTTEDVPNVLHSVEAGQQSPEGLIGGGRKPQDFFSQGGVLHSDNSVGGDLGSNEHFGSAGSYFGDGRTTKDLPNVLHSVAAREQSPEGFIAGGRKPQKGFLQAGILHSDNTVGEDLGSPEYFGAGGSYSLDGRTTEDVPNVLHSVEAGQQSPEVLIGGGQKPQDFSSDGGVLHSDNSVGGDLGSNEHFRFAGSYFGDGRTTGDLLNVLHSVNVGQQSPEGFVASRRKPQKSFLEEGILHSDNTVGGGLGSPEHFSDLRSYSRDRHTTEHVPNVLHSVEAGQQSTEGLIAGGRTPQDGSSHGGVLSSDNTLNGDLGAPEYFGSAGSYSRVGRTTGDLPSVLHSVDARQQSPESFIAGGRKPQKSFLEEGILHSDNTVGGDIESPEHFSAGRSYPRYRRTTEDVPNVLHSIEAGQQSPEGLIAGGRKPQDGSLHGGVLQSDNTVGGDIGSPEHIGAGGSYSCDGRTTGGLPIVVHSVHAGQQSPAESLIAGGQKPQYGSLEVYGGVHHSDNTVGGDLGLPELFGSSGSYSRDGRTTGDLPNVLHSVGGGQRYPEGFIAGGRKLQEGFLQGSIFHSDNTVGGDLGSNEHFSVGGSYSRDGRTTEDVPNVLHSVEAGQQSPEGLIGGGRKLQDFSSHGGVLHSDNSVGGDLGSLEHFSAGGSYSRDGRTTEDVPNVLHSVEAGQQSPGGLIGSGRKPQDFSLNGGVLHSDNSVGGDLGSKEHFGSAGSYFGDGRTTGDLPNVLHSVAARQQSPEGFIAGGRKPQKCFLQEGILHSDYTVGGDLGLPEHFSAGSSYSRDRRTTEDVPNVLHSVEAGQQSPEGLIAGGRKLQDGSSHGGVLHSDNTVSGDLREPEHFGSARSYTCVGRTTGELPNVLHSVHAGQQSPESLIGGRRKSQDVSPPGGALHSDNIFGGDVGSSEYFGAGRSKSRDRRTIGNLPYMLRSVGAGQLSAEGFIAGGRKPQDGFLHGGLLRSDNTVGGDLGSPEHFGSGGSSSSDGRTTGVLPNVLHSVGTGQQTLKCFIAGGRNPHDDSSNGGLSSDEDSTAGEHVHVPTYYPIGGGLSSDSLVAALRKWRNESTTGGLSYTYDSVGGGSFSS